MDTAQVWTVIGLAAFLLVATLATVSANWGRKHEIAQGYLAMNVAIEARNPAGGAEYAYPGSGPRAAEYAYGEATGRD